MRAVVDTCDTLLVELAFRAQLPLATFDRKVLDIFPEIAKRPSEIEEERRWLAES